MCEFEQNILQLLKDEKKRLLVVFLDKDTNYLKSLDHGIKSAEKNLNDCLCKQSIRQNYEVIPPSHLQYLSNKAMEYLRCSQ
jgi:hypothetical protein